MTMAQAKYALREHGTGARLAEWDEMDGFFVGDWTGEDLVEDPDAVPSPRLEITLRGLAARDDGLAAFRDPEDGLFEFDDFYVEVLDPRGTSIGAYNLAYGALEVDPGGTTGHLWADATLAPHAGARAVWDVWRSELPRRRGLWAGLSAAGRVGWVEAAMIRYFDEARGRRLWPMPEGDIVLDGSLVVDLAGFFCAVGEAFNGPGGYFGSNFSALDDCLRNLDRPPGSRETLLWADFAATERAWTRTVATSEGESRYLDLALETLTAGGVDIVRG